LSFLSPGKVGFLEFTSIGSMHPSLFEALNRADAEESLHLCQQRLWFIPKKLKKLHKKVDNT